MTTTYIPSNRAWVVEAHTDEDGRLELHMFPVHASGSLASVPAINVALEGFEHGDDED